MARTIAKDHGEKRGQILASAARLFAEEGVERASMTQVAKAAGISKANIYHYWDSKDALLYDLLDGYLSELHDRVMSLPKEADPEVHLRAMLLEILLAYQGADDEHRVQAEGIARLPEAQAEVLRGYQKAMVRAMRSALMDCAPDTFAAHPEKLQAAAMSVYGMLNWFYMWNRREGPEVRADYAKLVADMVLRGLPGLG